MKFKITRTSLWLDDETPPISGAEKNYDEDNNVFWLINVDTLEELIELCKQENSSIIVFKPNNGYPSLEIYDDYRE